MSDQWIVIPRWDEFQHYKDRDPTWIKNYTRLLHDDAYLKLTGHTRSILHGLWLEYASSNAQLTLDTHSLSRRLNLRVSSQHVKSLSDAGFIEVSASKPLAQRYQAASPEKNKRREDPQTPTGLLAQPAGLGAKTDNSNDYQRAVNMVRNGGWQYEALDFHAELAKFDLTDDQVAELEQLRVKINGDNW